jgi:hypothetical protein
LYGTALLATPAGERVDSQSGKSWPMRICGHDFNCMTGAVGHLLTAVPLNTPPDLFSRKQLARFWKCFSTSEERSKKKTVMLTIAKDRASKLT